MLLRTLLLKMKIRSKWKEQTESNIVVLKKKIIYKTSMRVREENIDEKEKRNENLLGKLPFGFFLFLWIFRLSMKKLVSYFFVKDIFRLKPIGKFDFASFLLCTFYKKFHNTFNFVEKNFISLLNSDRNSIETWRNEKKKEK